MKIMHVEARKKFPSVNLSKLNKLPGRTISLAATIQYLDLVPKIKEYLERLNKKIIIKKGAFYKAHVLGCQSQAFDKKADTLLLIADGKFHALNNAIQLNREIYVFNTKTLEKITRQEIDRIKQKIKAKQKKFLMADKIGILVSIKPGQFYKNTKQLKKKIEKLNKKVYIFEADNIRDEEFENFPDIKIWVNTACPGLALENPKIINYQDILEFL